MESLMEQMNTKLDKIMDLLEKRTTSQESQTDSSNSTVRQPVYPVVSSQYAYQERSYPLHLRYYRYHLSSSDQERENAIRKALKDYSKEKIMDRLTYLLSIWNRNRNIQFIDNLKHDITFVSNIQ